MLINKQHLKGTNYFFSELTPTTKLKRLMSLPNYYIVLLIKGDTMDFMTAAILSGFVYDTLKNGLMLTANQIKTELKGWLIDDEIADHIADRLNTLELTDELSEKAIEQKIIASPELVDLINNIKPLCEGNTIIQTHSGGGDNVGRDKIVHK